MRCFENRHEIGNAFPLAPFVLGEKIKLRTSTQMVGYLKQPTPQSFVTLTLILR